MELFAVGINIDGTILNYLRVTDSKEKEEEGNSFKYDYETLWKGEACLYGFLQLQEPIQIQNDLWKEREKKKENKKSQSYYYYFIIIVHF